MLTSVHRMLMLNVTRMVIALQACAGEVDAREYVGPLSALSCVKFTVAKNEIIVFFYPPFHSVLIVSHGLRPQYC